MSTPVLLPYTRFPCSTIEVAFHAPELEPRLYYCGYAINAYPLLLRSAWRRGDTFVVVEHDVVVSADAIGELLDCPEPWCAHGYYYPKRDTFIYGLGCVKFDEVLLAQTHDLVDDFGRLHWQQLDDAVQRILQARGYRQHRHRFVGHVPADATEQVA